MATNTKNNTTYIMYKFMSILLFNLLVFFSVLINILALVIHIDKGIYNVEFTLLKFFYYNKE